MHYFIGHLIISVCVKCFDIDVRIYGTLLLLPFFLFCFVFVPPAFFGFLILMYAFIVLVLFGCQADFDVDNVQRRELVNVCGV